MQPHPDPASGAQAGPGEQSDKLLVLGVAFPELVDQVVVDLVGSDGRNEGQAGRSARYAAKVVHGFLDP